MLNLYDAHNHFHDERLLRVRQPALLELKRLGLKRMVVNGSCEQDWPEVLALAEATPEIIPSFGYHPWYIKERSARWLVNLEGLLDRGGCGIGEIGLDRWIKDFDIQDQERVFTAQMTLAAQRNLPVSIHCLQAWGLLHDLLRDLPRPECGFLLHSFGGPQEMILPLAKLGAYFSLPGYFAHPRKDRQREAFRHVPPDRLLIETDAPDQLLPPERVRYPLEDPKTGKPINHPANLMTVYEFAAELLGHSTEALATQVEQNFHCIFGPLMKMPACQPSESPFQKGPER